MNFIKKNISLKVLVALGLLISIYRITNVNEKEISWDILGYYLPLPATFVHNDHMLNDVEWVKKVNEEKKLADTLYMISSTNDGRPMYFFFLGMALFYLPFFLLGHAGAHLFGYPPDGFSPPYQYALVIGGIIYTLIGLFYLRKVLKTYFSEQITALVLVLIVVGTNYAHHLTLKNLETVTVLFMLLTIITWSTIKWHENKKFKNLLAIGVSITLMTLVKPSEIIVVLLPVFWGVFSIETFKQKIGLILNYKFHFIAVTAICFLIASPQIMYWYAKTGEFIYDTYKNPGVGLDVFNPHIISSLFSYRKGWLVYTPIMLFSLVGFYFMYKKNRPIFWGISIYFLVSFYVITSWTEWWYGAGFSNRPLITLYPILAIALGYFIEFVAVQSKKIKIAFGVLVLFFVFLNQFQWWQLKNYILDPYRTTKDYYWKTFLKTSVSEEDKKLLLVKRVFSGEMNFNNKENYRSFSAQNLVNKELNDSNYIKINNDQEFALTQQTEYKNISKNDHVWVSVSFELKTDSLYQGQNPCMVFTMDRKEGNYGYYAPEIKINEPTTQWKKYQFNYLTPEIRDQEDKLKYYIWKRSNKGFEIRNFAIEVFEKTN